MGLRNRCRAILKGGLKVLTGGGIRLGPMETVAEERKSGHRDHDLKRG